MPPLIRDAEVAALTRFQAADALGEQGLEFGTALERIVVRAALGEADPDKTV